MSSSEMAHTDTVVHAMANGGGEPAAVSKKLQRRLAKAQYRAQQKAERATGAANGDDTSDHRQRKRRSQRDCNRHGALKRLAASDDHAPDETPDVSYTACSSRTCGDGQGCRLRAVAPYVHRFETFVKARWCGRSLGDLFLHDFAGLSAAYCHAAIAMGLIRINRQPTDPDYVLRNGDYLEHTMHRHEPPVHVPSASSSSSSSFSEGFFMVHHEDDEVVVVSKPSSLPVHPSGAYLHNSATLMLQSECEMPELFPVHRLDRLTSGLLLFAKSAVKAKALCDEIASGGVQKHYIARVVGEFPDAGSLANSDKDTRSPFDRVAQVDSESRLAHISRTELDGEVYWQLSAPIGCVSSADHLQGVVLGGDGTDATVGSKSAETLIRKLRFDGTHSVVECLPITGRTHQIRVHLQFLGFPIVNDPLYGPADGKVVSYEEACVVQDTKVATKNTSDLVRVEQLKSQPVANTPLKNEDEAARCKSICSACREGDGAIFSDIQQHCFTMWLHSFKYESSKWKFEVPLPSWAAM